MPTASTGKMKLSEDQTKAQALLKETITLLLKNELQYKAGLTIEALIGVTVDDNEVFLVNIKESVRNEKNVKDVDPDASESESADSESAVAEARSKRKRSRDDRVRLEFSTSKKPRSDFDEQESDQQQTIPDRNIRIERESRKSSLTREKSFDNGEGDLVFVEGKRKKIKQESFDDNLLVVKPETEETNKNQIRVKHAFSLSDSKDHRPHGVIKITKLPRNISQNYYVERASVGHSNSFDSSQLTAAGMLHQNQQKTKNTVVETESGSTTRDISDKKLVECPKCKEIVYSKSLVHHFALCTAPRKEQPAPVGHFQCLKCHQIFYSDRKRSRHYMTCLVDSDTVLNADK